ncbi:hypothetical protein [Williamwhitmania taraxaci]|uniref:Uncharacterized protein n=1 Tax=Williamwhitmania taraxaci TaxID=1640674 RepID=A0A1G6GMB8_9BACT|nr:hypothetical protein [Williamwhitmania taraxaci]SDB83162.1 hypothetical protein SAMN05216323_100262 [Williamwhitmania taraxaci]
MKRVFFVLFSIAIIFSGCSKDDDDKAPGVGTITYKGVTYSMPRGFIDYYPTTPSSTPYNLSLTLHTEGLNYDGIIPTGTGSYIAVDFLSTSSKEITPGAYTINHETIAGTVIEADLYLNVDFADYDATKVSIVSGTITVAKSNSEYTITLNGKNYKDESITGTYVGSLEYFVVEDGRK